MFPFFKVKGKHFQETRGVDEHVKTDLGQPEKEYLLDQYDQGQETLNRFMDQVLMFGYVVRLTRYVSNLWWRHKHKRPCIVFRYFSSSPFRLGHFWVMRATCFRFNGLAIFFLMKNSGTFQLVFRT